MHDDLKSFKQNPSQKFCKNLTNFEKPQNFQKPQKLGQETWNAWWNEWKRSYQMKEDDC